MTSMGDTAAEACSRISTEAENIKAAAGGTSGVIDSIWGALSPKNYSSGDNETEDIITNIINTNLSECEILKIDNDCNNSSAGSQTNIIDTTDCALCTNPDPQFLLENPDIIEKVCSVSGVSQQNASEIEQTCTIHSAIETLLQKTNSVEAQALAEVLQESTGLLSGDNSYTSDNCTLLNTDMSSAQYIENRSSCSNEISINQENIIKACGATNVIQENNYKNLQTCLIQSDTQTASEQKSATAVASEMSNDQKTEGLIWESSVYCGIICGLFLCSLLSAGVKLALDEGVQDFAGKALDKT
jgi:hypothetical protein